MYLEAVCFDPLGEMKSNMLQITAMLSMHEAQETLDELIFFAVGRLASKLALLRVLMRVDHLQPLLVQVAWGATYPRSAHELTKQARGQDCLARSRASAELNWQQPWGYEDPQPQGQPACSSCRGAASFQR